MTKRRKNCKLRPWAALIREWSCDKGTSARNLIWREVWRWACELISSSELRQLPPPCRPTFRKLDRFSPHVPPKSRTPLSRSSHCLVFFWARKESSLRVEVYFFDIPAWHLRNDLFLSFSFEDAMLLSILSPNFDRDRHGDGARWTFHDLWGSISALDGAERVQIISQSSSFNSIAFN